MDYTLIVGAAGEGLRLQEVSQEISKPLTLVAGRPILGWALSSLEENPPERAVIVATSESLPAAQELAALELPDTDIGGCGPTVSAGNARCTTKRIVGHRFRGYRDDGGFSSWR